MKNGLEKGNNTLPERNNDLQERNNKLQEQNNTLTSQNNNLPEQNNKLPKRNNNLHKLENILRKHFIINHQLKKRIMMFKNWTPLFIYHVKNNKHFTILNVLGWVLGLRDWFLPLCTGTTNTVIMRGILGEIKYTTCKPI